MDNGVVTLIKELSICLGLLLTFLGIIKYFKENGTGRTIGTLVVITASIVFVKFLILLASEDIDLMYLIALLIFLMTIAQVLRYLIDNYRNKCFRMSHKEYLLSIVSTDQDKICLALLFVPIVSMIINRFFPQPLNVPIENFIQEIRLRKINYDLYVYLWNNLLFTLYYLIKLLEVFFTIYCCETGSKGIRGASFSTGKLFFMSLAVLCTLFFISSNIYYEFLIRLFAQFG